MKLVLYNLPVNHSTAAVLTKCQPVKTVMFPTEIISCSTTLPQEVLYFKFMHLNQSTFAPGEFALNILQKAASLFTMVYSREQKMNGNRQGLGFMFMKGIYVTLALSS